MNRRKRLKVKQVLSFMLIAFLLLADPSLQYVMASSNTVSGIEQQTTSKTEEDQAM